MNIQNVDRSLLKSVLIEILKEQPHLLKSVVKEIIKEKSNEELDEKELMKMIDKDFEEYDDVFRALA